MCDSEARDIFTQLHLLRGHDDGEISRAIVTFYFLCGIIALCAVLYCCIFIVFNISQSLYTT